MMLRAARLPCLSGNSFTRSYRMMDAVFRGKDMITNVKLVEHCVLAKEFPTCLSSNGIPVPFNTMCL